MLFTDSRGREHEFQLGAYQTDFHTGGFREFSLVYLGKGTAADYSQADVAGKLVLIDINQRDEWWINFPVYQARLKGAAALIAVQEQGYGEISDTALNAQDIAGPADAPAFSMSRADAGVLKAAMGEENQVRVRLDASSTVLKDQETYNIIGTIPGTEEGMINHSHIIIHNAYLPYLLFFIVISIHNNTISFNHISFEKVFQPFRQNFAIVKYTSLELLS